MPNVANKDSLDANEKKLGRRLQAVLAETIRRPKTHSDVLWHFTGGPAWNSKFNRQNTTKKRAKDAYEILLKILESKELRVGRYHEVAKVRLPLRRRYDFNKKKILLEKNVLMEIRTSPVCCIADIPSSELFHHANRYGCIGIGFKRASMVKAGFNPVFYTLHDEQIGR